MKLSSWAKKLPIILKEPLLFLGAFPPELCISQLNHPGWWLIDYQVSELYRLVESLACNRSTGRL